ncbi:ComF family protein [Chitinivorax sp. PXF-14]|uniref:ComF family protein n=1 Tax=Chitinivorax sp. PXF-14 TaxID=3230488 RepID=UPI0034663DA9
MQWLLPASCVLCGTASGTAALCPPCRADLPWLPAARCPVCALPTLDGATCGACLRKPPAFDATHCSLAYAFPLDTLLHAAKYGRRISLLPLLATLLAEHELSAIDLVLPMPLSPARLAERGFNQSLELARPLARHGLTIQADSLAKPRETPHQADLPWKARVRNIKSAFVSHARLDGLRVLLVDDVMTTGASLNELARVARQAGAARVETLVLARTLPHQAK